MSTVKFRYLSQEDVVAAGGLDMKGTLEVVEDVLRLYGEGQCVQPVKPVIRWSDDIDAEETGGRIMSMPAYIGGSYNVAGMKWIPSIPDNPAKRGLPRANALIILTDRETGMPLCVMDGTIVSAMRTGAVTALGAKYLGKPDAEVFGVVGAGVLGRTQIMAFAAQFPNMRDMRLFDINHAKAEALAEEMKASLNIPIRVVNSAQECIEGSDCFVTATMATEPYVVPEWMSEGSYYSDMSSHDATDELYLAADRIFVDDWAAIKHHGNVTLARLHAQGAIKDEQIDGELPLVIAGKQPGRQSPKERIIFRPIGMAVEDVAEAYRVYRNAVERGVGQELTLWERPIWM